MIHINVYGIMRGGIHVFIAWLIKKTQRSSVLYYNNVKNTRDISDRLIKIDDTRIDEIRNHITNDQNKAEYTIKSFESRSLDVYASDCGENIIVLRNPFNILASSLKYKEKGGESKDVYCDERLLDLWKMYANEYLNITHYLPNKIIILYDHFISNENYRMNISRKLNLPTQIDSIVTLGMGGGSSFDNSDKNYLERYKQYESHPMMIKFKHELSDLWEEVKNYKVN